MRVVANRPTGLLLASILCATASGALYAQPTSQELPAQAGAPTSAPAGDVMATVNGTPPADLTGLPAGPDVEGVLISRKAERMVIKGADSTRTPVLISTATSIKSSGGFLGMSHDKLAEDSLVNGLPVSIKTVQWGGGLVASQISFKDKDLKTAMMIRNGTDQRFGEQGEAIAQNAAATEALRNRVADIDNYDIKGTTNVYFDTGKWKLSAAAKDSLCAAASQADGTSNALLLVVGYTDSVGNEDYNQVLSEKRAGAVINYLQQACHWKPWRVLTPTGMAEADPAADNSTAEGRRQNRRVAVNILVSKSVDGL